MAADNTANLEKLLSLAQAFEETTLGKALRLLVNLAEAGFRLPTNCPDVAPVDDRLLTPKEASRYLGISWPTLRDSWVDRYDIKSLGEGRGKRFRVSELRRVILQRESEAERGL